MWKQQANAIGTETLAARLGIETCPCCENVPAYPRRDRIGSMMLRRDGGWHCFACSAGGDAVALLAAYACGSARPVTADGWAAAERVAAGLGLTTGPTRPEVQRDRIVLPPRGSLRHIALRGLAEPMARRYAEVFSYDEDWKPHMRWCMEVTLQNVPHLVDAAEERLVAARARIMESIMAACEEGDE